MIETAPTYRRVPTTGGTIVSTPADAFGYYGWPSVLRALDGTLYVVASGMRHDHVCPFGRTTLSVSDDEGASWAPPRVIGDTPLDDRDGGIVQLADGRLLASWFTMHHGADLQRQVAEWGDRASAARYAAAMARFTPAVIRRWFGSWTKLSADGGATWGGPRRAPVTAPHGPVLVGDDTTPNGTDATADRPHLLYVGKQFLRAVDGDQEMTGAIAAYHSTDNGGSWQRAGAIATCPGTLPTENHEPHALALGGNRVLALIRLSAVTADRVDAGTFVNYSMAQSLSTDGGQTWCAPQPLGFHGSTPHLMRHSSGALVVSYGYRQEPYGVRVMCGEPDANAACGVTWRSHYVIRDDGVDRDLGYPATVELSDRSLLTVSYQRLAPGDVRCSLVSTRWTLPG